MLPESKNIQTMGDNIRLLDKRIDALDVEIPPHGATDAGKILAVDSEGVLEWKTEYSYTPPAYSSTEEVNTGKKWIDGRDIYCKVYDGIFPVLESAASVQIEETSDIEYILDYSLKSETATSRVNLTYGLVLSIANGTLYIQNVAITYSEKPYFCIIYYVKKAPVSSTETKSKKGGTKK